MVLLVCFVLLALEYFGCLAIGGCVSTVACNCCVLGFVWFWSFGFVVDLLVFGVVLVFGVIAL